MAYDETSTTLFSFFLQLERFMKNSLFRGFGLSYIPPLCMLDMPREVLVLKVLVVE